MVEDPSQFNTDSEELPELVAKELIEKADFSEKEAQDFGNKAWFEELEKPDAGKRKSLYEKASTRIKEYHNSHNKTSNLVDIKSVNRTSRNKVQIDIPDQTDGQKSLILSSDSSTLGDIMSLAGVEDARELEGCRFVAIEDTYQGTKLLIPSNLSLFGRLKYKIFIGIEQILEKTRIRSLSIDAFSLGYMMAVVHLLIIPAAVGSLVAVELSIVLGGLMILPAVFTTVVLLLMVVLTLIGFILQGIRNQLEEDVYEVGTCSAALYAPESRH